MCELLGLCFSKLVQPKISFRAFRLRSKRNPDGWGLAFYPNNSTACIFKEPIKSVKSLLSKFVSTYPLIKSKIFIAHVRRTSVGSKSYKNTHPFSRELNGKEYVFAHNGTLSNYWELELGRFKPIGETDSEYVFCYLLKCFEERGIDKWTKDDFAWLSKKLREINAYGKFNCIFSDGEYLFCYYDKNGYNGLCFVHRKAPFGRIRLLDEDWSVNLAEEKDPSQEGYVIASNPLTNEEWQTFYFGELIVFKDGKIVFSSSQRKDTENEKVFNEIEGEILKVLRKCEHRVPLGTIIKKLKDYPERDVKLAIRSLLCRGYVKQDRRNKVSWDNYNATFFTNPERRSFIDEVLGP